MVKRLNVFVICDERQREVKYLKEVSRENIAKVSEEVWRMEECLELEQLKELVKQKTSLDVMYLDVTIEHAIEMAEQIRKENKDAIFLLIADKTISPMAYLKPSIQAASLLLRPLKKEVIRGAVADTWNLYLENHVSQEECFVVDDGVEHVQIPYQKICYFSSNAKKVYLVLENQEFGFYDTLGNLEKRLPAYFVRSHRSYIVNQRKIQNISLAKGELMLDHDICVPISRSYKANLRELKKCLK